MKRSFSAGKGNGNGERASVLIITLLVSAIVFMIAVSFSTMVTMESRTAQAANDSSLALYEADAGLRRAYVELVNMKWDIMKDMIDNSTVFRVKGGCLSAGDRHGSYSVHITFIKELAEPERYEVTKLDGDDFAGSRGRFRWRFKIVSEGEIGNAGTTFAHRSILAYVDIQRAETVDEYRGTGIINYWSELNR